MCNNEESIFKYEQKIITILENYFISVDKKNPDSMLRYVTIPLNLHFGSEKVVTINSKKDFEITFDNWKQSPSSKFQSTELKSIQVEPTWIADDMLAVADVTYNRLDKEGEVIRTERALYHFIRGNGYYSSPIKFMWTYLTRWMSRWKIYMISNIEIDN
ncbi:MAG: hypothetical protein ACJZ12_01270 [Candidatus Neomarinimicrobiota bacterium]